MSRRTKCSVYRVYGPMTPLHPAARYVDHVTLDGKRVACLAASDRSGRAIVILTHEEKAARRMPVGRRMYEKRAGEIRFHWKKNAPRPWCNYGFVGEAVPC